MSGCNGSGTSAAPLPWTSTLIRPTFHFRLQ